MKNLNLQSFAFLLTFVLYACGGGGSAGGGPAAPAAVNVTGTWSVTETMGANTCGNANGVLWDQYTLTASQSGDALSVTYNTSTYIGSVSGHNINWTGSYPEDGGTTTITDMDVVVASDGQSFSGSVDWTWSGPGLSCSGTTFVTGSCVGTCGGGSTGGGSTSVPPSAPTNLQTTAISSTTISIAWTDNSDNESSFVVERSATSGTSGFSVIATLSANTTTYSNVTGLVPSTTYWYRVKAQNTAGSSSYSAAISATTDAPAATPPAAPSNLNASAASSSAINLTWTDNSSDESGFLVYMSTTLNGTYSQIAQLGVNTTSYQKTGLSASTTYFFKVAAYNNAGNSAQTSAASATTDAPPVVAPAKPSNFAASNVTSSGATLSWTDNSNNETGFQIGQCTGLVSVDGNGNQNCITGYVLVAQVGANVTSYNVTGLSGSTGYTYFLHAFNASAASSMVSASFTTLASQTSTTLVPINDNMIQWNSLSTANENTVYSSNELAVGCNWSLISTQEFLCAASLLKFNTSTLVGKTIDAATLTLEVNYTGTGFSPNWVLRALATTWSGSTVTWANFWFPGYSHYPVLQQTYAPPTFGGQIYNLDITDIVQAWASGTINNFGLIFETADYTFPFANRLDAFSFYSKEVTGAGPKLNVTYH